MSNERWQLLLGAWLVAATACSPGLAHAPPDRGVPESPVPQADAGASKLSVVAADVNGHYRSVAAPSGESTGDIDVRVLESPSHVRFLEVFIGASWVGSSPGQVNVGQLGGMGALRDGRKAHVEDRTMPSCTVDVELRDSDTVSVTNETGHCGGLNVTLDGTYRRSGAAEFEQLNRDGRYASPASEPATNR